jgi:hypothetical protein
MMQNFLGKDSFIWWIGTIEDINDPLGIGRCRVRIFGWHYDGSEESKIKIPKENLPWAVPLVPMTTPRSSATPFLDDWVMGFFFDGLSGQFPVIVGIIPGFFNPESESIFDPNNPTLSNPDV